MHSAFTPTQFTWTNLKRIKMIHGNGMNYIMINEKHKICIYFILKLFYDVTNP